MRLNAFLAKAGVASRRGADELIKAGRVSVNGSPGQLNSDVSDRDDVKVEGKTVKLQQNRYILLHKSYGYITTTKDPHGRKKVTDLVNVAERVVPVGRLDYDTTGVLLLTNDGALAHKLMHPSGEIDKTYEAEVNGEITDEILNKLRSGVNLDGRNTATSNARKLAPNKIVLTIHEGRYHQVKRMLGSLGLEVVKLHRSNYAGINVMDLKPGHWRELTEAEVTRLKMLQ